MFSAYCEFVKNQLVLRMLFGITKVIFRQHQERMYKTGNCIIVQN
jgi:hypothetical protein